MKSFAILFCCVAAVLSLGLHAATSAEEPDRENEIASNLPDAAALTSSVERHRRDLDNGEGDHFSWRSAANWFLKSARNHFRRRTARTRWDVRKFFGGGKKRYRAGRKRTRRRPTRQRRQRVRRQRARRRRTRRQTVSPGRRIQSDRKLYRQLARNYRAVRRVRGRCSRMCGSLSYQKVVVTFVCKRGGRRRRFCRRTRGLRFARQFYVRCKVPRKCGGSYYGRVRIVTKGRCSTSCRRQNYISYVVLYRCKYPDVCGKRVKYFKRSRKCRKPRRCRTNSRRRTYKYFAVRKGRCTSSCRHRNFRLDVNYYRCQRSAVCGRKIRQRIVQRACRKPRRCRNGKRSPYHETTLRQGRCTRYCRHRNFRLHLILFRCRVKGVCGSKISLQWAKIPCGPPRRCRQRKVGSYYRLVHRRRRKCSKSCGVGVHTYTNFYQCQRRSVCGSRMFMKSFQRPCFVRPCRRRSYYYALVQHESSPCSVTCGQGTRTVRLSLQCRGACTNLTATRNVTMKRLCWQSRCPRLKWGSWGNWTVCTRSCGFGVQTKHRQCSTPGGRCPGGLRNSYRWRRCNTQPCEGNVTLGWSPCSISCGYGGVRVHSYYTRTQRLFMRWLAFVKINFKYRPRHAAYLCKPTKCAPKTTPAITTAPPTKQVTTAEKFPAMKQTTSKSAPTTVITTSKPTTAAPTTMKPTTAAPTTMKPTTAAPTTMKPTTATPTTMKPTTAAPTTMKPTTVAPTTMKPTTVALTTMKATTAALTTAEPTEPTRPEPTEPEPTEAEPTEAEPEVDLRTDIGELLSPGEEQDMDWEDSEDAVDYMIHALEAEDDDVDSLQQELDALQNDAEFDEDIDEN